MKTIAILGLGKMGKRMAFNYIDSGYVVHLWNRSDANVTVLLDKGAILFATPKECVINVDIAISMLKDDIASKEVWLNPEDGAIDTLDTNTIAIECSTISVDWSLTLHKHFKKRNIAFLDAPVLGSLPQAEAKQLIHLVGGNTEIISRVKEVLSASASMIYHVGKAGNGTIFKLAVNGIFGIHVVALSEVLSFLNNLDIDKKDAINILNQLPVTSQALQGIGMSIANNNYKALFPIDLVEKDFKYLLKSVKNQTENRSLIELSYKLYNQARKHGYGQDNISGIAQLYKV